MEKTVPSSIQSLVCSFMSSNLSLYMESKVLYTEASLTENKFSLIMEKSNLFTEDSKKTNVDKSLIPRGIRNNNPFNIKKSFNSWLGKRRYSRDSVFEQFSNMDYGLRAGFLLLRNGYLAKGYNTVPSIVSRYAPSSENNVVGYCKYITENSPLDNKTVISINSLSFYWLVRQILRFESCYDLSYDKYLYIIKKFNLW